MATPAELAETIRQMGDELIRRIDGLEAEGHMDDEAAASLFGILEWVRSIEDAVRQCNGKPSPRSREEEMKDT